MLPPGINPFARGDAGASMARARVLADVSAAITRARQAGVSLMEVEFPAQALIGKTQFDDFSNIEMLNANRDFAFELVPLLGLGGELLVCLLDEAECKLALEAYPGSAYASASAMPLSAAALLYSGRQAGNSWLDSALSAFMPKAEAAATGASGVPPKALRLVVQPCEEGRVDDWLNMELLNEGAGQGVPIVCLNGYLDKQRSGYYPKWQFPDVTRCGAEFLARFDPVYFLKPMQVKGRVGWILRVHGEPWQLFAQERERAVLLQTFDSRPSYDEARDCLLRAGSASAASTAGPG
ncbi:hypothetical protein KFE25_005890 [Diacronema lutheri]|uniref:DUF1995 domain-containing protein n=2 Tax=Diacronema lutheri TaxID=2081491 RepID=A0A8J5Y162_DIALT|nr:hypothetical protein KFE25_005890 [Diacronema lutheri]